MYYPTITCMFNEKKMKLYCVHDNHLSPYKGNEVNSLEPPPPDPVTVNGKEKYEVDHIRDSKMFSPTPKYLICWKGYGEGEDTWEPAKNLAHAPDRVTEFHTRNPGAPQKINAMLYASLPWQAIHHFTLANMDVNP